VRVTGKDGQMQLTIWKWLRLYVKEQNVKKTQLSWRRREKAQK